MKNYDWVIAGGGIIGLTIASRIREQWPQQSILILEKESALGAHGSGRNSGVLHAGIYYPPHTLRAKFCVEGARMMREFCDERKLPILKSGKLIIATDEREAEEIGRLEKNALENGVQVEKINSTEISKFEPNVNNQFPALHSPNTAVVAPKEILKCIKGDLDERSVETQFIQRVVKIDSKQKTVQTDAGDVFGYGFLINTAGNECDYIAKQFGIAENYKVFPFRGSYFQLKESERTKVKMNIYPVPDKRMPFLGVHYTPCPDGNIYVGPTATPAFGRQNYYGFENLNFKEGFETLAFVANQVLFGIGGMRGLVFVEAKRFFKSMFFREARRMMPKLKVSDLLPSKKCGIRSQLVDVKKGQIITDYTIERADNSLHILNAPSPAFTSSWKFSEYVLEEYLKGNP